MKKKKNLTTCYHLKVEMKYHLNGISSSQWTELCSKQGDLRGGSAEYWCIQEKVYRGTDHQSDSHSTEGGDRQSKGEEGHMVPRGRRARDETKLFSQHTQDTTALLAAKFNNDLISMPHVSAPPLTASKRLQVGYRGIANRLSGRKVLGWNGWWMC